MTAAKATASKAVGYIQVSSEGQVTGAIPGASRQLPGFASHGRR
jgi:hypothetical protein